MTYLPQNGASIIVDPNHHHETWAVYEHWWYNTEGDDQLVYVNACKLADIIHMREARNNSHWLKWFDGSGRMLRIVIVATYTDMIEAQRAAMNHIKKFDPIPPCNLYGSTISYAGRPIMCSNGQEYATQSDAATALGLSQSNLSEHLRGRRKSVKGYTFQYKG